MATEAEIRRYLESQGLDTKSIEREMRSLNDPMCCNGYMCGCGGATYGAYIEYQMGKVTNEETSE